MPDEDLTDNALNPMMLERVLVAFRTGRRLQVEANHRVTAQLIGSLLDRNLEFLEGIDSLREEVGSAIEPTVQREIERSDLAALREVWLEWEKTAIADHVDPQAALAEVLTTPVAQMARRALLWDA